MPRTKIAFPFIVCLAAGLLSASSVSAAELKPFLEEHCLSCHEGAVKKGGLDLAALPANYDDQKNFAKWVKVYDRMKAGEMPPKKSETIDAKELAPVLAALEADLTKADRARSAAEGRATYRRLTRSEYEATVQDLLDLPGMPLKEELPPDGSVAGFDKVGEALDVSHVQMAKYMEAANFALDRAVATRPEAPKPFKVRNYPANTYTFLVGLTNGGDCVLLKDKKRDPAFPLLDSPLPGNKFVYYEETVCSQSKSAVGIFRHTDADFNTGFWKFSPVLPGRYKFRLSIWSYWWDKGEVLPSRKTQVAGVSLLRGKTIGFFDAPSLESKVHEFEVWLEPNDAMLFTASSLEHVHVYSQPGCVKKYQGPGIAVDWLDIEGPINESWPPASHRRLFGDLPLVKFEKTKEGPAPPTRSPFFTSRRREASFPQMSDHGNVKEIWTAAPDNPAAEAKKLLAAFLPRAFRRPVSEAQTARYLGIVTERLKDGDCFENALRLAYAAALCSPEFLFRIEKPGKLDDYAIANRLSYFLWNSLPDAELLEAARRGDLKKGGEQIRKEVRRMIKDPRSNRFVEDFLGQWLALSEIASTTPDHDLYPEFKPYMQDCMAGETRAFFRDLLDHNLGIGNLVESDFAYLNAELGQLYGIADAPAGHDLCRVFLPPGSHRGGLLTQAAILKVTANGTNTSPVKRGAWIMDRLLGQPPEPPPPNVAAVEPDLRGATTIRQQLDRHRSNASCAACHAKIDPPGFALESYDVIGRYRERYRAKEKGEAVKAVVGEGHYGVSYKLGLPVDCAGEIASGETFKDLVEFKKLLLKDQRQLARNFLGRVLIYATGREAGFADRQAIEMILDRCEANKQDAARFGVYGVRSLIEELCTSELFLAK